MSREFGANLIKIASDHKRKVEIISELCVQLVKTPEEFVDEYFEETLTKSQLKKLESISNEVQNILSAIEKKGVGTHSLNEFFNTSIVFSIDVLEDMVVFAKSKGYVK